MRALRHPAPLLLAVVTLVVAAGSMVASWFAPAVGTPSEWALARAVGRADPYRHAVGTPCLVRDGVRYCFGGHEREPGPTMVFQVTTRGRCFDAEKVLIEDHGARGDPFSGCVTVVDQVPRPWHEPLPEFNADQVRRLVDATQPDPAAAG